MIRAPSAANRWGHKHLVDALTVRVYAGGCEGLSGVMHTVATDPGPNRPGPAPGSRRCLHKRLRHSAPSMSRMARVLVVDDEPAVRRALERALRLDGYDVDARRRRRGGARRAGDAPPDAVDPRRRDAPARRPGGLPAAAPGRRPHADPDADRARRDRRPRRRASTWAPTTTWSSRSRCASCRRALRALLRRAGDGDDGEILRFADLVLDPSPTRCAAASGRSS